MMAINWLLRWRFEVTFAVVYHIIYFSVVEIELIKHPVCPMLPCNYVPFILFAAVFSTIKMLHEITLYKFTVDIDK